jgi:hypothetical protein
MREWEGRESERHECPESERLESGEGERREARERRASPHQTVITTPKTQVCAIRKGEGFAVPDLVRPCAL